MYSSGWFNVLTSFISFFIAEILLFRFSLVEGRKEVDVYLLSLTGSITHFSERYKKSPFKKRMSFKFIYVINLSYHVLEVFLNRGNTAQTKVFNQHLQNVWRNEGWQCRTDVNILDTKVE